MRYLTVDECAAFGEEGSQNEVRVIRQDGEKVITVAIFTQHASGWREPRHRDHGSETYGRLVAAADKRKLA